MCCRVKRAPERKARTRRFRPAADCPLMIEPAEARVARPNDICYVIYTSGSTGNPKGVLIEHRNAVNFIKALHKVYGLKEDDRVYQGFSIAFDASVEEIWAALSLGGTLVVPSEETLRSTLDAAEFITAQHVTCSLYGAVFLGANETGFTNAETVDLGGRNVSARPGRPMGEIGD